MLPPLCPLQLLPVTKAPCFLPPASPLIRPVAVAIILLVGFGVVNAILLDWRTAPGCSLIARKDPPSYSTTQSSAFQRGLLRSCPITDMSPLDERLSAATRRIITGTGHRSECGRAVEIQ